MRSKQFVHCEHVNPVLLEHSTHVMVANELPLVRWILKFVLFDILPDFLDGLRS